MNLDNIGNVPFDASNVSITGTNASDFQIYYSECLGTVVIPGRSCYVQLTFTPVGDRSPRSHAHLHQWCWHANGKPCWNRGRSYLYAGVDSVCYDLPGAAERCPEPGAKCLAHQHRNSRHHRLQNRFQQHRLLGERMCWISDTTQYFLRDLRLLDAHGDHDGQRDLNNYQQCHRQSANHNRHRQWRQRGAHDAGIAVRSRLQQSGGIYHQPRLSMCR